MYFLERRSAARRRSDQRGSGDGQAFTEDNNRRARERRAGLVRLSLSERHLDFIRAAIPPTLQVERVTYVVYGPAYAWLADVATHGEHRYLVGAEQSPEALADPAEHVMADILKSLQGLGPDAAAF